ncbi:tyrosine-type recombinase/integrase [Paenibacillus enshidis]|uniref:Tyrosine-type recombinase/integrase n=1 Tax=Paenibacillus enshidis TaxID=1458439 RepID=A0ABV5AZX5_9BACL
MKEIKTMYQYYNEVKEILTNYLETIPNDASKTFYKSRINKFFVDYMSLDHNSTRPLNTINFHDINTYIESLRYSSAQKLNCYNAFFGFFKFSYNTDKIPTDVMKGVRKPEIVTKETKYIDSSSIEKLNKYVSNDTNAIEDRLLIGFFLYTGLSRKYIANLTRYQISRDNKFVFFELGETTRRIPLSKKLIAIIQRYFDSINIPDPFIKIFDIDENYVSEKLKILSNRITGEVYTPTDFSNTFIREALKRSNDILTVSELTMESVTTIMKHVFVTPDEIMNKQKVILEIMFGDDDNIT